jgi:hypothetical protein
MNIYITQQQRTSGDPILVNFPTPFAQPPAVLVTPFWQGEGKSVGSVETVLTPITADACKISSGNQASNYWVNVLAIDPTETELGILGIDAGVHAKMQAGQTTVNFADPLKSNDPVVLLAPQWTSPVGYTECLVASAASEISTYSQNMAPGGAYSIEYLAADRGASSFQVSNGSAISTGRDSTTGLTQIETGTDNKTGSGIYRVYFQSPFSKPPVVFLSSWWNGTQGNLGSIETLLDVTNEFFDAISDNVAANYFVNWMAFGNT